MASAQLQLINTDKPWKLDRRTVEIGRAGLAQARAALAAATEIRPIEHAEILPLAGTDGSTAAPRRITPRHQAAA